MHPRPLEGRDGAGGMKYPEEGFPRKKHCRQYFQSVRKGIAMPAATPAGRPRGGLNDLFSETELAPLYPVRGHDAGGPRTYS